ncbi:DUF58 domain-containing protein [Candidatus Albibeggiatoa sp. nov. NOAA]|uniref:DUF58 domain-containing protein n=1 Tax=Candidatus Albibeggiatoa sp. nov. NOAA TaxID=3162724 RepID=UPI0032FD3AA4|nr:DUF58 domain-containing protein [Thiotrichaceae bacterium]
MFKQFRKFIKYYPAEPKQSVQLTRKQVYILPTRHGFLFVLVLFVMLLGSINYNNNMGFLLTFLLASTAMVSMLHAHYMLHGLKVSVGKANRVFVGEQAQFQLWVDNQNKAARYALHWSLGYKNITSLLNWSLGKNSAPTVLMTDIPADQRTIITIPMVAKQRGQLPLEPLTVSTRFPFGLFYVWAFVYVDASTLVYPAPLGLRQLPKGAENDEQGDNASMQLGRGGDDFIGYRDYKVGDSPKHVDWKAVARGQDWHIKQFGGASSKSLWLSLEQVQHLNIEAALSQLCLWVLVADSQNAQYGLKLPQQTIKPDYGEQHREKCLTALALYGEMSKS